MLTFNHRIAYEFDKLVKARTDAIASNLVSGHVPDMEYLRRCQGEAAGLELAREFLQEALSICEGRDK